MFKNALVSVSDKTGLADFIKPLVAKGMRVVSTGGTARYLKDHGIDVVQVSEQTQFPEVMDGRVKTLHPRIHMCLLARDFVDKDMQILREHDLEPFDLVVGNLYAFEKALVDGLESRELQEFIDIGGPSLLRAAAKNFSRIAVVCDPNDYQNILHKGELEVEDRRQLAAKVFAHVSAYDGMVASALGQNLNQPDFSVGGKFVTSLRYGENPQQQASWYRQLGTRGLQECEILQGKPLSYNNLLDLDAAVSTLLEFAEPTSIAVKHNNPCGVGIGKNWEAAVEKSIKADPVSVFGGIVAINGKVSQKSAELLTSIFLECVIAPDYSPEAMRVFAKKKNLRVMKATQMLSWKYNIRFREILGGVLVQSHDQVEKKFQEDWVVHGDSPSPSVREDLLMAWKVCAHLKSNAIALAFDGQSIGLGMGQVNRVDAVEQAISRAEKFHNINGAVAMASDAFFPFADSVELAARAGIKWIIQPGGSIKDDEVIATASRLGVNLVMTGRRHFMH